MATFLLELFSEEIPSRMQRGAAEQLQRLIGDGLAKQLLTPSAVKSFVSPRHLALQVEGLPLVQPDVTEERKGPKIGAPEQALKGFLGATGLTLEQCEQRDGYYIATFARKGRPTSEVLKEICEAALSAFGWPKSMRWGARPMSWVRPLHSLVCLLDDAIIPVQFQHLTAGRTTRGHRFLAPQEITLAHAEEYEQTLLAAKVMVNRDTRRAAIWDGVQTQAAAAGLQVAHDDALLDEVTGLVEWPVPLLCQFDASFLDLPPEVLISEMKVHQRYFPLQQADGRLADRFITVSNMETADSGARIQHGNGRVVRARLADGAFYWEQDRRVPLVQWGEKLKDVVFHAKVGMMDAKVQRIEALAVQIAQMLSHPPEIAKGDFDLPPAGNGANNAANRSSPASGGSKGGEATLQGGISLEDVRQAARLCKADLTSGMVGEFPELQGIMGRYYANHEGLNGQIAEAIYEHYKPQGAGDSLPESDLGAILSIADKLDSIVSLFAAGEKPTGSKDPLALRRAALGIVRILFARGWDLDLAAFTQQQDILAFFADRVKVMLKEEGIRHDIIEASFPDSFAGFNPLATAHRTRALATWLATAEGEASFAAIKRALNILAAEEKKSKQRFEATIADSLSHPAEQALAAILASLSSPARGGSKGGEASLRGGVQPSDTSHPPASVGTDATPRQRGMEKLNSLTTLATPIQTFFTELMVTEEGHREARLGLLATVRDVAHQVADFGKIEG